MVNDVIADSLTRIRNASMRRLDSTILLYSKSVISILEVFQAKNYISGYKVINKDGKQSVQVILKYNDKGASVISEIKRLSSPGRRVYKGHAELKSFKNGYGTIVVSTSKGVISNDDAYKNSVGGELLCSIW